jgi:hypothetical protein
MRIFAVLAVFAAIAAAAGGTTSARASGGDYAFDGGTPRQQAQVRAALQASSFDWDLVARRVTIHVASGTDSYATPGEIWLDADLLDAGRFAWSTVQHEFAHEVDFLVLTDDRRAALQPLLGGGKWFGAGSHDSRGSERFAETLTAAYWSSSDNLSHSFAAPATFRAALAHVLGARSLTSAAPRAAKAASSL